jgi:hypothetical protein
MSAALHAAIETTDMSDTGESAEEHQLNAMILKTKAEVEKTRENLLAHDWSEAGKRVLDEKNELFESLLERREEYHANRATVEAVKAQIHDWNEFYSRLTPGEKARLFHTTVERIDVNFDNGTALIRWTFSDLTTKIDLTREEARSRDQIRASQNTSIHAPVLVECGQVVDHADPSWNLFLSELRTLSAIVDNSAHDYQDRGPASAVWGLSCR